MGRTAIGLGLALATALAAGQEEVVGRALCDGKALTWQDAPTRDAVVAPGESIFARQRLRGTRRGGAVEVDLGGEQVVFLRPAGPAVFQVLARHEGQDDGLPARLVVELERGRLVVCAPQVEPETQVVVTTRHGQASLEGPGAFGVRRRGEEAHVLAFRGTTWVRGDEQAAVERRAVPAGTRAPLMPGPPSVVQEKERGRWLRSLRSQRCPEACAAQLLGPAASPRPGPPAP
jgi:hypothetical protein